MWPLLICPKWGTVDAEIKVQSVKNPELTKFNVLPLNNNSHIALYPVKTYKLVALS